MSSRRDRRGLRPAADGLRRLGLTAAGAPPAASVRDRLAEAWKEVAPRAAGHSWPERISRSGVLTIACADAGWAQELDARADDLRPRLAERIPDHPVARLRFVVAAGPAPRDVGGVPPRDARVRPGRAHTALAAHAVAGVEDEELREALRRTIALALALRERQRDRRG